jgi:uroporphyrinogen-III synthase
MHSEQIAGKTDVEWVNEIGGHIAAGNTLDDALAITVSLAVALVNCESCFIYVRDREEMALWLCKQLEPGDLEQSKIPVGRGYAALLGQHRVPMAISRDVGAQFEARMFDQWSADPGETLVSVPLLARQELVGIFNLRHRQPRRYRLREVKLLSAVGRLLGAGIGISCWESRNSELLQQLETRKLVERGKGILQRDLGLSEEEAFLRLQQQSRRRRKPMKEIAEALVLGDEFRRSALNEPAKCGIAQYSAE